MLVKESLFYVDSDYTIDFRSAIGARVGVVVASEAADLMIGRSVGDAATRASSGTVRGFVRSVRVLSLEDTAWRVQFLERVAAQATPANLNRYGLLGSVDIYNTGAVVNQASVYGSVHATSYLSGTVFVYLADGLNIPIVERTAPGTAVSGRLHVNLCNIGPTAKSAGDVGAVHLRVGVIAAD